MWSVLWSYRVTDSALGSHSVDRNIGAPKIVHIMKGKADPDTLNGVNRVVHGLATAQTLAGRNVEVWGITGSPEVIRHSHRYTLRLFRAFGFRFSVTDELRRAIAEQRSGRVIFHFHSVLAPEFYAISRELRLRGLPWVQSPHGGYHRRSWRKNWLAKQVYFHLFERHVLQDARMVQAMGPSEVANIESMAPHQSVVLIPNGVEPLIVERRTGSPSGIDSPIFGYCGRLVIEQKGLDSLLRGFALYVSKGGRGSLIFIGDGDDRHVLERLTARLGISVGEV